MTAAVPETTNGAMIFAMYFRHVLHRPPFFQFNLTDSAIGTFFGGDQLALREYHVGFWAIHDYFIQRNEYVGCEQHLMSLYLTYTNRAWIQPNYLAMCNTWFSTFSFYSDVDLCFRETPSLKPHTAYFDQSTAWNYSINVWLRSVSVPSHPFAG
jgi:hypothetical protein